MNVRTFAASFSTKIKKRPVALQVGSLTRYLTAEDARTLRAELNKALAAVEAFESPRPRLARMLSIFAPREQNK